MSWLIVLPRKNRLATYRQVDATSSRRHIDSMPGRGRGGMEGVYNCK